MYQEFYILSEYGFFVWSSFVFTLVYCFLYYVKTKKELRKQEKIFLNEFIYINLIKAKTSKEKEVTKEILSVSSF